MNKGIWVIALILLICIGCGNSEEVSGDLCSKSYPQGVCTTEGYQCVQGTCRPSCSDTIVCPSDQFVCDQEICYFTQEFCSSENPYGRCLNNYEICQKPGICVNDGPCGKDNYGGQCDTGSVCYQGVCIEDDDLRCRPWRTDGVCPTGYSCSSGYCTYPYQKPPCSPVNTDGKCGYKEICVSGFCIDKTKVCGEIGGTLCPQGMLCDGSGCVADEAIVCSTGDPFGYCETGTCIDGTCIDITIACSKNTPYGTCSAGEYCRDGSCLNPNKQCTVDLDCPDPETQTCDNNRCIDRGLICSEDTPNGPCYDGYHCVSGVCVEITDECSLSNPTGTCDNDAYFTCIDGRCQNNYLLERCSVSKTDGHCPRGESCIDGSCQGTIQPRNLGEPCWSDDECYGEMSCDTQFDGGYCTISCSATEPCSSSSAYCHITDTVAETGVCLRKCTPGIGCDRGGYLCIPYADDIGYCLHSCEQHQCFSREGETCGSDQICE